MKDRIRQIRKEAGLTQAEFAETLGATRPMVTSYEVGAVVPPPPMVELICYKYSVRRDWLLTGEGEPYDDANLTPRLTRVLRTNPALENMLRSSLDLLTADDWRILNDMVARIVSRKEKE